MIGEVAAVLSALKVVNDSVQTLRDSKEAATSLNSVLGKWGEADQKFRDVEIKHAGTLDYKSALAMEQADRRLKAIDQTLKDVCLMQGQADLYHSIRKRMDEARYAHEKKIRAAKIARKKRREMMKLAGTIMFAWVCFMGVVFGFVWVVG